MKNTSLLFSVAALLSFAAIRADLIETSILENDPKTLALMVGVGITHNNTFAVSKGQKDKYVKLAAEQVEKAKASTKDHFSIDSVIALDWAMIFAHSCLTAAGVATFLKEFHASPKDQANELVPDVIPARTFCFNKLFKIDSVISFGLMAGGIGNTIRNLKDFAKHLKERASDAKSVLKKAERVQILVDKLPVK